MKRTSKTNRQGAAATEFALILPVLLILTFGTIEMCSAYFLKETCLIAAHEGARIAITQNATSQDVIDRAEAALEDRGVDTDDPGVQVLLADPTTRRELQTILVRVRVPMAGNGILPNPFYTWFSGRYIESACTMYKEFDGPNSTP